MIRKYEKENLIRMFMPFMVGLSLLYRLTPTWIRSLPVIGKTSMCVYAVIALVAAVITIRHFRFDAFYLWLVLFLGLRVFATWINGKELGWVVLSSAMCYSLVVILCYSFRINKEGTLKVVGYLTLFLLVLNMVNVLQRHGIMPGDWFKEEFIENHNSYIQTFLIAITALYLNMEEEQDAKSVTVWLLLFLVACVTYYYERSATSIVGLSVLYLYLFLFNRKVTRNFLNIKVYLLVIFIFFIGFVCGGARGEWTGKVLSLMGKNSDLTRRTMIWRDYLAMCKKSPVIGYGVLRDKALSDTLYGIYSQFDTSAHNIILNIAFQTGLSGLLALGMTAVKAVKDFLFVKNENVRFFFEAMLGVTLMMSMFEAYPIEVYLILLSVMFVYSKVDRSEKGNE